MTKIFIFLFIIALSVVSFGFTRTSAKFVKNAFAAPAPTPVKGKPPYSEYRGVTIGLTMNEARAKLGDAKDKSDTQEYYVFSDNESAQIYYNEAKTVTAVTITFTGKLDAAPTALAVFGEEVEVKPDGGIFKMIQYPKLGFWISYNKITGDDPLIIIAMQKM